MKINDVRGVISREIYIYKYNILPLPLGRSEGAADGFKLGISDGDDEGLLEGDDDGCIEGVPLGWLLGEVDSEGLAEGDA